MTQQWDETPERDMTEKDYGDESQPQQHCGHECVCFLLPEIEERIPEAMCTAEHCEFDTRNPHHHLITDTRTGKQYTKDLQQLCIDAGLSDRLTYCDIECLLTDGETWYMLDECGNWEYLPSVYKVEEVKG
jgi:hypothetical protein